MRGFKDILKEKSVLFYFIVLFGVLLYYSNYALWLNDDINYGFSYSDVTIIKSIMDIFPSQWAHYFIMNGRFPAHFLVQLFIGILGKTIFSIVNAVVYVYFVWLVVKTTGIPKVSSKEILLTIFLVLLGFQTKYVPSCMIGYIWMYSIILLFLHYFFENRSKHYCLLIPLSFFAGWSNESLVIGISVALFLFMLKNYKDRSRLQWYMFFSFAIGAGLLCLAPSNFARTKLEVGSVDFLSPWMYSMLKFFFYSRVLYLLLFAVVYLKMKKLLTFKIFYKENDFWIHALLILVLFNVSIGVFGNRQLFGIELISIVLLLKLVDRFFVDKINYLNIILTFIITYKLVFNIYYLDTVNRIYDDIEIAYKKSKNGTVFYDLSAAHVIFNETYPCENFTIHVLRSMNRWFHYKENESNKVLRVLPTCCNKLEDIDKNLYVQNGEDAYSIVVTKKSSSENVIQHRAVRLLGLNIPIKERCLNGNDVVWEDNGHIVYQVYDKIPFVKSTNFVFQ